MEQISTQNPQSKRTKHRYYRIRRNKHTMEPQTPTNHKKDYHRSKNTKARNSHKQ